MTNEIRRLQSILQIGDFIPSNNWQPPQNGLVRTSDRNISFKTHGPVVDRIIFLAGILIGSPIQSAIATIHYILQSISVVCNVLSLPCSVGGLSMEDKIVNIVFFILRTILIIPVALFVFEGVCILGLFAPNNATKIYRAVETLAYGNPVLGSIFSPN